MKVTKETLVNEVQGILKGNSEQSKRFIKDFFQEIENGIVENGEAKLRNFGTFSLRDKRARPGRNPQTKEPKIISARRVITFRAGHYLNERLNEGN